ncbi:MAG: TfoX/Sxy family protein [Pseudomonadales bacterium]|nr:TfoX/Sxy family protein [Pseudomonadales bacterium]
MAKEFLDKLNILITETNIEKECDCSLEAKHFFSGAALYNHGVICASLSPVGIGFKLGDQESEALIEKGLAVPLKYFPKGHIKKGYALFEAPDLADLAKWKQYLKKTVSLA